ncbi:MAG: hypothetical protein Q4B86_07305 [Eubacteriales bacterium]|nr:hypothetical protein [Eubacteriales bacterium]
MKYIREQKHICGYNYDSAKYMEVDLYPISDKQHRASYKAKRNEASSLAQQNYNDKRAKRYHVQLVNTNFTQNDYSLTLTYDEEHLPECTDIAQVDRDYSNYIKKVYRWCDKHEVKRPKWIAVAEYTTIEDGEHVGRHHFHGIIEHTEGLTREVLEDLWGKGFTRCERLDFDHGSVESLVRYISKNKRCKRRWRQSRGLRKPVTPKPNDTKWSRKKFEDASKLYIDDAVFWERQYPGYTLNRVETTVTDTGHRHTLIILRRLDAVHGEGRRKRETVRKL